MTTREFNHLLHVATTAQNLNPSNTYVELKIEKAEGNVLSFRPLLDFWKDVESKAHEAVFSRYDVKMFPNGVPTGFFLNTEARFVEDIIHRPLRLSSLLDNKEMLGFDHERFVLAGDGKFPVFLQIDPFDTTVYLNAAGDCILALAADMTGYIGKDPVRADEGRCRSLDSLKPEDIHYVEDGNFFIWEN